MSNADANQVLDTSSSDSQADMNSSKKDAETPQNQRRRSMRLKTQSEAEASSPNRTTSDKNKSNSGLTVQNTKAKQPEDHFKKPQKCKGQGKKTIKKAKLDDANMSTSGENIQKKTITNLSNSSECFKLESSNEMHVYADPQPSTSTDNKITDTIMNIKNVTLFGPETEPQMYHAKGNLVTPPIITCNLPKVFQFLPIFGKPEPEMTLEEFYRDKLREYIGCTLTDEEFDDLENYCSPELLKTGNEIQMQTNVPIMGLLNANILHNNFTKPDTVGEPPNLVTLKMNKIRQEMDVKGIFTKKLKYRGVRILPFSQEENDDDDPLPSTSGASTEPDVELEPGSDILYRVRIYRPYTYSMAKDRFTRSRHSVFCCDVLLTGRHKLTALRDRFVCHNDFDMRVDLSEHPDVLPTTKAKAVFPSGFLFINNVFYVDTREGCKDYSEPIREWAIKRKLGRFPKKDMCQVTLGELVLKLGYPEVYVHQGNCEHVFLFSEVRLLNASDPLRFSNYPCSTAIAQNQTVYCTTCAEFSAKWIVVGSDRVPFDPGFFCDTCFKQYMYIDGKKIGNFKAYRYRGNALNVLRP